MTALAHVRLIAMLGFVRALPGLQGCSPVTPEAPPPHPGDIVTGKIDANTVLVQAPDYRFAVGDAVVMLRSTHCRHGHCRFSIVGRGAVANVLEPALLQVHLAPGSDVGQGDFVQPARDIAAPRYEEAGSFGPR
jgi:hypothetical protein